MGTSARIAGAALLLGFGLVVVNRGAPEAGAANPCGVTSQPCVVVPGLVAEPVLRSFPSYPSVPVDFALSPDGRIFVADKSGRVLVYAAAGATSSEVSIDLRAQVNDYWDRGLIGLALDPAYSATDAANRYVYVLYTYDKNPFEAGAPVPRWGGASGGDGCPSPPNGMTDGCPVTGRVSRYHVSASGVADGAEQVLLQPGVTGGWCEQFPGHTVGTIAFGPDGNLYVGAGDGSSFNTVDYGQLGGTTGVAGVPRNPCGDPSSTPGQGGRGGVMQAPGAEGGSLKAQSARSTVADGYSPWDASILRINKDGSIPADNPLVDNGVPGDDPIVAIGVRNPFRFDFRPGTRDLWIGDVGAGAREEVSHFDLATGLVPNFGWPCYEGNVANYEFTVARTFSLCTSLSTTQAAAIGTKAAISPLVAPQLAYGHYGAGWNMYTSSGCLPVVPNDPGASVTGGVFVTQSWPSGLTGAYVFGDYSRQCLWALPAARQGSGADPEVLAHDLLTPVASNIAPVAVRRGAGGDLYVLDLGDGSVGRAAGLYRIGAGNLPTASFAATPTAGAVPLAVTFDGRASTAVAPATVTAYEWDLDGNGSFEVAGSTAARTYTTPGTITASLRVTDSTGRQATTTRAVVAGAPPIITGFTTSLGSAGFLAGDTITYDVAATDPGGQTLRYDVQAALRHCSQPGGSSCHAHVNPVGLLPDARSANFVAPAHDGYSYLQLTATVTNALGLSTTATVDLPGHWLTLTVDTEPAGLTVVRDGAPSLAPLAVAQIGAASTTVRVDPEQVLGGTTYRFVGWADGPTAEARTLAPAAGTVHLVARFVATDDPPPTTTTTAFEPPTTTTTTLPPAPAVITTRVEAEDAVLTGPLVVAWGSGYTGTGWITGWTEPGQAMAVSVTNPSDGPAPATVTVRYKASFLPARRGLQVNGTEAATLSFAETPIVGGDWTNWAAGRTLSATVMLPLGGSTLTLVRVGTGDGPLDVDNVEVAISVPPPPTTTTTTTTEEPATTTTTEEPTTTTTEAPTTTTTLAPDPSPMTAVSASETTRYEAEEAALAGPTIVTWGAGFTGPGWVTGWSSAGQSLTFTVTNPRPTPVEATLAFRYKAPFLAASRTLTVNGAQTTLLHFALTPATGGDWTNWASGRVVALRVTLPPGTSSVTLVRSTSADGPLDIDRLDVIA